MARTQHFAAVLTLLLSSGFLASLPVSAEEPSLFDQAVLQLNDAQKRNDLAAVEEAGQLVFALGKEKFSGNPEMLAAVYLKYGNSIRNITLKTPILEKAFELHKEAFGEDSPKIIEAGRLYASALFAISNHASFYRTVGRKKYLAGHNIYFAMRKIAEKLYGADSLIVAKIYSEMSRDHFSVGSNLDGASYAREARYIAEKHSDPEAMQIVAETHYWQGRDWLTYGSVHKGHKALLKSMEIFDTIAPTAPLTLSNHALLIQTFERQGLPEEATKHCLAIGKAIPAQATDREFLPVYRVAPVYPKIARRKGMQGEVVVNLTVDKDGFVRDPAILSIEGHESFAQAALEAVRKFRYVPRFENNAAVDTPDVRYTFTFTIRH